MQADVYKNALLVISASCCSTVTDSFLGNRFAWRCEPVTIAWTDDEARKPLLHAEIRNMGFTTHHP